MSEIKKFEGLRLSNMESNKLTKQCIESALLILMDNQDFRTITITDIVKRAGVSRTAYYRNYNCKEDILQSAMNTVINNIMSSIQLELPFRNSYTYWFELFSATKVHSEILLACLKANFEGIMLIEFQKEMQSCTPNENYPSYFKAIFWSGAICNVLITWLREDMKNTSEEMAEICFNIVNEIDKDCNHNS